MTNVNMLVKNCQLKPIVKWAGGKGQLIEDISQQYPQSLGFCLDKYAEPFVGGGAVLFDLLSKYNLDEVFISDSNAELINMYIQIRDNPELVISHLKLEEEKYLKNSAASRKTYYLKIREKYNLMIKSGESSCTPQGASLFIFLNRTCFNGLYRVNRGGLFNVPAGSYKKPLICNEENLRNVSASLEKVNIVCGDYRESRNFIDSRTFVYFDPPYRPLSNTSSFTSYTDNGFDDNAQKELANFVFYLNKVGAYIMISNSDPKNSSEDDNFFDFLYAGQNIRRITANRMINSKAGGRGKISELLITNY